jgi:hypothetical protein
MRAQTVFGDDDFELEVILTKLGDKTPGSVTLTIIFLAAILLDNGLRHEWNHFALVGVDERLTQHLMGVGHRTISVVFFQTRVAVNRFGGKIARAIKG